MFLLSFPPPFPVQLIIVSAILRSSRDYVHRGDRLDAAIWTVIQIHLCQMMDGMEGTSSSSSPGRRYVVQSFRVTLPVGSLEDIVH